MPNKKISQLSTISPVPTGGLMLVSNGGVSRSATVKDVAEAITDSVTTFTGMSDTPDAISGNMFVVGNPGGTELIFTNNLNLICNNIYIPVYSSKYWFINSYKVSISYTCDILCTIIWEHSITNCFFSATFTFSL